MIKKLLFNIAKDKLQRTIQSMVKIEEEKYECIRDKYIHFFNEMNHKLITEDWLEEIICKREEYLEDLEYSDLTYLLELNPNGLSWAMCKSFTAEEWQAKSELEDIIRIFDYKLNRALSVLNTEYEDHLEWKNKSLRLNMSKFDNKKYSIDK